MKNAALLCLLSFGFISFTYGQDFSLDEMAKLKNNTYPEFESKMHEKGYEMDHLEHNERCTVFRKGSNVLSYCHYIDNGYSYHTHVGIKFETTDKDQYEKMKKQVEAGMQYYKTRLRRYTHEHYMEHIYVSDAITAHLYDITFDDGDQPYYEVEVKSIYAPY